MSIDCKRTNGVVLLNSLITIPPTGRQGFPTGYAFVCLCPLGHLSQPKWDTGGSETYRSVVSHYLRGADGVMMCFDVNSKVGSPSWPRRIKKFFTVVVLRAPATYRIHRMFPNGNEHYSFA